MVVVGYEVFFGFCDVCYGCSFWWFDGGDFWMYGNVGVVGLEVLFFLFLCY